MQEERQAGKLAEDDASRKVKEHRKGRELARTRTSEHVRKSVRIKGALARMSNRNIVTRPGVTPLPWGGCSIRGKSPAGRLSEGIWWFNISGFCPRRVIAQNFAAVDVLQ